MNLLINKLVFLAIGFLLISCDMRKTKEYVNPVEELHILCSPKFDFYYINGVLTEKRIDKETAKKLSEVTGRTVVSVYNPVKRDIFKALKGILEQNKKYDPSFSVGDLVSQFLVGFAGDSGFITSLTPTDDEIEAIQTIIGRNDQKSLPVVMAHSHGNVVAHELCEKSRSRIRTIHLANPTKRETDCSKIHVGFKDDGVLDFVGHLAQNKERSFTYSGNLEKHGAYGYHGIEYFTDDINMKKVIRDNALEDEGLSKKFTLTTNNGFGRTTRSICDLESNICKLKLDKTCDDFWWKEQSYFGVDYPMIKLGGKPVTFFSSENGGQSIVVTPKVVKGRAEIHVTRKGSSLAVVDYLKLVYQRGDKSIPQRGEDR